MNRAPKIYESQLYSIWKNQEYKEALETISGDEIEVLDPGVLTPDVGGPDFKNARIRIGNLTYVGDIEIDPDYNDWKSHGHNIDTKYEKVILHISLTNKFSQPYVYTKDGRKVPTICLSTLVDDELISEMEHDTDADKSGSLHKIRCFEMNEIVPLEAKEKFISQLGMERFNKKCSRIYSRLKELEYLRELNIKEPVITYDLSPAFHERQFVHEDFKDRTIWEQLLHELLFEALGYSKNKTVMMNLAQYANVEFLKQVAKQGDDIQLIEAALFKISGMIPDMDKIPEEATRKYAIGLDNIWNSVCSDYDGKSLEMSQWHFFRLRPQNFPTVRLAGGARIFKEIAANNLIGTMIKKIDEIRNLTVLINSLRSLFVIKSEGFWQRHYVFDQSAKSEIKYFVGASRADEILINVILPYFSVYFEIFGNEYLAKKVLKLYNIFNQRSDNKIINEVADSLQMSDYMKKTIYAQGMMELFRSYCSKNKCLECEIGKIVFN